MDEGEKSFPRFYNSAQNQRAEQQKAINQERKPNQAANPMPSHDFASFLCPIQRHLTILGSSCPAPKSLFQSYGGVVPSPWQCASPLGSMYTHVYGK